MPNKPLKYGIKLWCLCDAASAYCANLQVYTGMIDRKREVGQSKRVVLDLVHPTLQSGRNITADNFFRPMDWPKNCWRTILRMLEHFVRIVAKYLQICYQIGNAQYIRHCLVSTTSLPLCPMYQKWMKLWSYFQHCITISRLQMMSRKKPAIVTTYKETKGGADTLDKMCAWYSCKRSSRRWPVSLFFGLLDHRWCEVLLLDMLWA